MSPRARLALVALVLGGLALFLVVLRLDRADGRGGRFSRLFSRAEPEPESAPAVAVAGPAVVELEPTPADPWETPFSWERAALVEGNRGEPFEIEEEKAEKLIGAPLEVVIGVDPATQAFSYESVREMREAALATGNELRLLSFAVPLLDPGTHSVLLGCNPFLPTGASCPRC